MNKPVRADNRHGFGRAKTVFAVMALVFVLVALAINSYAEQLGIDEQSARLLGIVFVVVALADYLILHFWDTLFARKGPGGEGNLDR